MSKKQSMGASSWYYFAPYQEDVEQVLQELRREIFEKGQYINEWAKLKSDVEQGRESYVQQEADRHRKWAEEEFNTMEKRWEQASKLPPRMIWKDNQMMWEDKIWAKLKSDIEAGREAYVQQRMGRWDRILPEAFNDMEKEWEQASKTPPQTIDEVLAFNKETGTHSILDIEKVSPSPKEPGTVSPFESETLLTLFGTKKPIREQIEAALYGEQLWHMLSRWVGRYCVVYQNDTPHEIFFVGFSGD